MAEELEGLVRPAQAQSRVRKPELSDEQLLAAVFDRLTDAAKEEQQCVAQGMVHDTNAKKNRRETYLNRAERGTWVNRSRSYLSRRRQAVGDASSTKLYSMVFLQHLLELDAADADLPVNLRCFEDTYTKGISDQFLLDAGRSRFTVEGDVFYFVDSPPTEKERVFVDRLVAAVRGATSSPALLAHATSLMSQSSLASLERACLCNAAVCGGSLDIDYGLRRDPAQPEGLLMTLQVHKQGFREYLAGTDAEVDDGPRSCDRGSVLRKSATVALIGHGELEVVDLEEEVHIVEEGEEVPNEIICQPIVAPRRSGRGDHLWLQSSMACAAGAFRRCRRHDDERDD